MAVWVFLQNTDFCSSWFEERLFNAVIAVVYIFCFFNLKEGTSRYRVFIFYSVIFVENVFCLILWNFSAVRKGIYTEIGFTIVFGGFFVGESPAVFYNSLTAALSLEYFAYYLNFLTQGKFTLQYILHTVLYCSCIVLLF